MGCGLWWWQPAPAWLRDGTIYVATHGHDGNRGDAPQRPLRTIQRALDIVAPGERIVIAAGIYHERPHVWRGGTPTKPIVITAAEPGKIVITGALREQVPADWTWESLGEGIHVTATRTPVYRLQADGRDLYRVPWGGIAALRGLIRRPGAHGAFSYTDGRLAVWLPDGSSPIDRLTTHRPAPEPREWGELKSATVWIEADHVCLENLRIEWGLGAAVNVWNAGDVELRDCAFHGATFGVRSIESNDRPGSLKLRRCLYHNFPQRAWRAGWLTWDEVYAGYASSTLLVDHAGATEVRDCLVSHGGDALRVSPDRRAADSRAVIDGNWFVLGTDDAVELDGDAAQVAVTNNLIYDHHQNFSVSPVRRGPVRIASNRCLHPRGGINGSQLKLIAIEGGEVIRNVLLEDNLFVGDYACWYSDTPMENVTLRRNTFLIDRTADPPWPEGLILEENLIRRRDRGTTLEAEWSGAPRVPADVFAGPPSRAWPGPVWLDHGTHPALRELPKWLTAN